MVGAKGLGDEARQAKWAPKGQSRRRAQARGHSAPHVDRRNRVQLVEEGGCRVTSKRDHRVPAARREKTTLPRPVAGRAPPVIFEDTHTRALLGTLHKTAVLRREWRERRRGAVAWTACVGDYVARQLSRCWGDRMNWDGRSPAPGPGASSVPAVLREPCDLVCSLRGNLLLRPVELGSVDPHAMQNDRELARDGDFGLTEPISLGEPHPPSL